MCARHNRFAGCSMQFFTGWSLHSTAINRLTTARTISSEINKVAAYPSRSGTSSGPEAQEAEMSQLLIKADSEVLVPIVQTDATAQQAAVADCEVLKPIVLERRRDQRGMVTAEWAVGIIAAAGLAGVLIAVLTSGPVESALLKVILHFIGAVADKF